MEKKGAVWYNFFMKKKTRAEKDAIIAEKQEKTAFRKQKRKSFADAHHRGIAMTLLAVFMPVYLFSVVTIIINAVFTSENVVIGENADNILFYDKPASKIMKKHSAANVVYGLDSEYNKFQQASLPIGSGDLGAAVFGEIAEERIVFNEKTLWSGGPKEGQTNYNGCNFTGIGEDGLTESQRYYAVQNYLLNGDTSAATKLFKNMEGDIDNKGSYLPWGDVYVDFGHKNVKNYSRTLDIDNSVAAVSYVYKNRAYSREYIASNPDKVIAMRFTCDGEFSFGVSFPSKQGGTTVASGNSIILCGSLADNGLAYYSQLTVDAHGGNVVADGGKLMVSGSDTADVFISAATDYDDNYPVYRTGETAEQLSSRVKTTVEKAVAKGYGGVRAAHVADYKSLYGRVSINLGGTRPRFTTDKLLTRYSTVFLKSSHRKYLEQLLYNYGRYLLISSSREDSILPANLQGVWNESNNPPWQSDYHLNINLQMNYWAAYNTNLAECASPLVEYVDGLREPGRVTAKTYTATEKELTDGLSDAEYGFIAHTECNPYGHTTPGTGKYATALWSPAAVAWLMQNLYEGYEYGGNIEYLQRIYPIMKEALLYFERTMVMYNGRLVTAPSYSPEHGKITAGNTYEQSLVWQLITDTSAAAKTLNVDGDKQAKWNDMLTKLNPIEIGSGGQIKEWYDETYILSRGMPLHRHTSHLLGLFPGDLINKDTNPEYAAAAKVSLDWRGTLTTGWAMGQRINTYARLGEGDIAYTLVKNLFRNGVYPNLFDAHPPFQIDGNFGYTSGVTEMLMQSNLGYIQLLPALPSAWTQGEIKGIVARGNFTVSYKWQRSAVTSATVYSGNGNVCKIKLTNAADCNVTDSAGNAVPFSLSDGMLTFNTEKGKTYRITAA